MNKSARQITVAAVMKASLTKVLSVVSKFSPVGIDRMPYWRFGMILMLLLCLMKYQGAFSKLKFRKSGVTTELLVFGGPAFYTK